MKNDWIEAFLVFSEYMNFTHAAERLHISQPALHVKIRKLSEFLDLDLYQKQGRNLLLTDQGRKIQVFAREMRDRSNEFLSEVKSNKESAPITLAAGSGAYLYLLGDSILQYNRTEKKKVNLITANSKKTIELLMSGQANIGVTAGIAVPDTLKRTLMTSATQVGVLPKDHKLAKKRKLLLHDFRNQKLILPPAGRPHRVSIEQALLLKNVEAEISVEAEGWGLMMQFVKLGAGITVVNSCCNIPAPLVAIPIPELPKIEYSILERINDWRSIQAQKLIKILLVNRNKWKR